MMNKFLEIFLGYFLILHHISGANAKEMYKLSINERGSLFDETIEVDDVEKTVVYKVPSHNQIKKTDVLVDYMNGKFVTRIPARGACYIKAFPTADEQSITQTKQNLKLMQSKKRKVNVPVSIETINTIMKIIREIPRAELNKKILNFCGNNTVYEVEEQVMPPKKGISIAKRTGILTTKTYSMRYSSVAGAPKLQKSLPNGYLTCKSVAEHTKAILNCVGKGKPITLGCGLFPVTCRYQATCNLLPSSIKKINAKLHSSFTGRDQHQYVNVEIKCVQQHKFTSQWCCDVLPCKN